MTNRVIKYSLITEFGGIRTKQLTIFQSRKACALMTSQKERHFSVSFYMTLTDSRASVSCTFFSRSCLRCLKIWRNATKQLLQLDYILHNKRKIYD